MKKKVLILSIVVLSFIFVGCTKKVEKKTENTSDSLETVQSTSSSQESKEARFRGKLTDKPTVDEETVRLSFEKVEAISDPEKISDNLNANGVVLLANPKTFDSSLNIENLTKDSEVEFTLTSPVAMTFSIPPQIAGNSITHVRLAK
ncbi:MAG: hypothetical protein RR554_11035 [Vagococcus sp.]|uniref:hypothetical protein n=1 Tax=Vagococcus sp. TaxID=1933889 RepID=UPI002FC7E219